MHHLIHVRQASGVGYVGLEKPEQQVIAKGNSPAFGQVFINILPVIETVFLVFGVDGKDKFWFGQVCKPIPQHNQGQHKPCQRPGNADIEVFSAAVDGILNANKCAHRPDATTPKPQRDVIRQRHPNLVVFGREIMPKLMNSQNSQKRPGILKPSPELAPTQWNNLSNDFGVVGEPLCWNKRPPEHPLSPG